VALASIYGVDARVTNYLSASIKEQKSAKDPYATVIRDYVMLKRKWQGKQGGRSRSKRSKFGYWFGSSSGFAGARRNRAPMANPSLSTWSSTPNQPDQLRVKIKSYFSGQATSTTGAVVADSIKFNGLLHPFTAFGSNHVGFAATNFQIYERYRVLGAKVEFRLFPIQTGTQLPMWCGLTVTGIGSGSSSTQPTNSTSLMETARAKWGIFPTSINPSTRQYGLKMYSSVAAAFGVPSAVIKSDPNFSGGVDISAAYTDPANAAYFSFIFQTADGAGTSTIGVDVVLTQYVLYEGRGAR